MSSDGWGSSFGVAIAPVQQMSSKVGVNELWHVGPNALVKEYETLSPSWPDSDTIKNKFERTNKVPTHDPYTNPDAQLYYSCNCGAILDPGTKRFAELNNYASKAGWKIRFTDAGYVPYCVECGKGME